LKRNPLKKLCSYQFISRISCGQFFQRNKKWRNISGPPPLPDDIEASIWRYILMETLDQDG